MTKPSLIIIVTLLLPLEAIHAQSLCTNGGPSCPSSSDPCFKVSSGSGTGCGITAGSGCINFGNGTGCQNNVRMCTCIDLNSPFTFTADFFFGSSTAAGVGDGLAFVLRPADQAGVGGSGGRIGYSGLASTWVAVEFDDYKNIATDAWGTDDPACQHSGVYQSGSTTAISGPTCLGVAEVRNATSTTYGVIITWNPTAKTLAVSFNGALLYTASVDLVAKFGASASCVKYSLTSATGGVAQDHKACNMNLSILPVTLTKFKATVKSQKEIELNWQTAEEVNNKEFQLLRSSSSDFNTWTTVAVIPGMGNSVDLNDYYYTDKSFALSNTTYYYKLKQIDLDGRFEESNIIVASLTNNSGFNIVNTGNKGQLKLIFNNSLEMEAVPYSIYDMKGREIISTSSEVIRNEIIVNSGDLSEGIYLIKLQMENFYLTDKLVINK